MSSSMTRIAGKSCDRRMPDGQPLSDGPNMLRIDDLPALLDQLQGIERAIATR